METPTFESLKTMTEILTAFERIEKSIESCKHYEQLLPVMVMVDQFKKIYGDDNAVRVLNEKLSKKGNELL